ncbi:hemerythrin domain-containing protein, partial [Burkholderia pseudomallei]
AQGVPCDSVRAAGATTADALAGAMLAHDCDLLCVGPALGDAAAAPPHACVADRLAARGIAVLTCAFRRTPAAARAIAALYAAHREAAGALGAWLAQLRAAIAAGRALDADAAHAIANGLSHLRDGRQPKAARRLYAALRGATGALDAELGELERQRLRNARMLSGLLEAIHAGIAREAPPVRLEHALSAYAQCVCEHAGRGEGVIVPAAQRYLADDDWRAIDASLALIASGPAAAARGA